MLALPITAQGSPTPIIEYAYDHGNRWVRKTLDTNADGTVDSSRVFVHDQGQIVLDFERTGAGDAVIYNLSHRYLWGEEVDQILADETFSDGTADDVLWTLGDHQNSVRDLIRYNPTYGYITVAKHVVYDAYGNVTSQTSPTVKSLFLYTARPFDADTGLQNNLNRWYDPTVGRWISADPIGFMAGDVNLYRYVGNGPVVNIDPTGWLTGIQLEAPYMDGSSNIWGYWEQEDCGLCLYVDGKLKYRKDNTGGAGALLEYPFDFDWLSRKDSGGTIALKTAKDTYVGSYSSISKKWENWDSEVNWAPVENLGLSFSFAHAIGQYRQYSIGGPFVQEPPVAVWESIIKITANWEYNNQAGNSWLYLINPSSPFGSATNKSLNELNDNVYEPPHIGPAPPVPPDYYTDASLEYHSPGANGS